MFWSITWNIMKRHLICAEIGVSRLKIRWTIFNTSTTVWATIMNILYIIYGVFILSQVEKSLSTITRRSLKQKYCTQGEAGPNTMLQHHWSICLFLENCYCLGKKHKNLAKSKIVFFMMNLQVRVWSSVQQQRLGTPLSLKERDVHTNLVSHVTIIQSSLNVGGFARTDQMITNVTTAMW